MTEALLIAFFANASDYHFWHVYGSVKLLHPDLGDLHDGKFILQERMTMVRAAAKVKVWHEEMGRCQGRIDVDG